MVFGTVTCPLLVMFVAMSITCGFRGNTLRGCRQPVKSMAAFIIESRGFEWARRNPAFTTAMHVDIGSPFPSNRLQPVALRAFRRGHRGHAADNDDQKDPTS